MSKLKGEREMAIFQPKTILKGDKMILLKCTIDIDYLTSEGGGSIFGPLVKG